jgi:hypothetical protein
MGSVAGALSEGALMPTSIERILGELAVAGRERGELVSDVKNLVKNFDQHVIDDDRRHDENLGAFREINQTLIGLNQHLARLVNRLDLTDRDLKLAGEQLDDQQEVVDGYKLTRAKLLGAGAVVMLLFSAAGWIVAEAGKLALAVISKKIGGG